MSYWLRRTENGVRLFHEEQHIQGLSSMDGALLEFVAGQISPTGMSSGEVGLESFPGNTRYKLMHSGALRVIERGAQPPVREILPLARAGHMMRTLYDRGGRDVVDLRNAKQGVWVDLRPGGGMRLCGRPARLQQQARLWRALRRAA
ncbi:MAG: hypothetical protein MO853_07560 [Candidatus Protistobacter heckmanni]|nr:hypothetical protein [Candidatus Protistobacter heckmanni]